MSHAKVKALFVSLASKDKLVFVDNKRVYPYEDEVLEEYIL